MEGAEGAVVHVEEVISGAGEGMGGIAGEPSCGVGAGSTEVGGVEEVLICAGEGIGGVKAGNPEVFYGAAVGAGEGRVQIAANGAVSIDCLVGAGLSVGIISIAEGTVVATIYKIAIGAGQGSVGI